MHGKKETVSDIPRPLKPLKYTDLMIFEEKLFKRELDSVLGHYLICLCSEILKKEIN